MRDAGRLAFLDGFCCFFFFFPRFCRHFITCAASMRNAAMICSIVCPAETAFWISLHCAFEERAPPDPPTAAEGAANAIKSANIPAAIECMISSVPSTLSAARANGGSSSPAAVSSVGAPVPRVPARKV